jgi:hypothetical protein
MAGENQVRSDCTPLLNTSMNTGLLHTPMAQPPLPRPGSDRSDLISRSGTTCQARRIRPSSGQQERFDRSISAPPTGTGR